MIFRLAVSFTGGCPTSSVSKMGIAMLKTA